MLSVVVSSIVFLRVNPHIHDYPNYIPLVVGWWVVWNPRIGMIQSDSYFSGGLVETTN